MYGHSALNRSLDTARPGRVPLTPVPWRSRPTGVPVHVPRRLLRLPPTPCPPGPRDAHGRFAKGWGGKPPGARHKHTYGRLRAEGYRCEPLEVLIAQCLRLERKIEADAFPTWRAELAAMRVLNRCLTTLMPYFHPRLR
jgi:hypothetical protein